MSGQHRVLIKVFKKRGVSDMSQRVMDTAESRVEGLGLGHKINRVVEDINKIQLTENFYLP